LASTAGEGGAANSTRPKGDSRHRHAAFGILFEHAFGLVDIPVDDQLHRRGRLTNQSM